MDSYEDKTLTVLRRKFWVGIPLSAIAGYAAAKAVSSSWNVSKWGRRGLHTLGLVGAPILTSFLIVHFNRMEIFRIGNSMMREMEELRARNEGPFADAGVRDKWDAQMASRKFSKLSPDPNIASEFESSVDYNSIVTDSLRK